MLYQEKSRKPARNYTIYVVVNATVIVDLTSGLSYLGFARIDLGRICLELLQLVTEALELVQAAGVDVGRVGLLRAPEANLINFKHFRRKIDNL
jgi:hypothetical protein